MATSFFGPDPDFTGYKRSCGIDFVRFFSTTNKSLPLAAKTVHVRPMRAHGHDGMLLTIQDPTPEDIAIVARELPTAVLDALEVYFDFTPRGNFPLSDRHKKIEMVRQWILSHLYPWQAAGIQAVSRVSKGRKHSELVFSNLVERRAERHETMYFGHSDSAFADPDEPNFASMKLYRKVTDNRCSLPHAKHRCRLEVTLSQFGCHHFGLVNPVDIFGFEFRLPGPYFRMVKPEVRAYKMPKLRAWNPRMAEVTERARTRMAASTLRDVGSHAACREILINVDGRHRHAEGNRMILYRLDDLTRRFNERPKFVTYGEDWASW